MFEKEFRAISATESGNDRWSVHFREVVEQGAPGSPTPTQESFNLSMSFAEASSLLGQNLTVTIAPTSVV